MGQVSFAGTENSRPSAVPAVPRNLPGSDCYGWGFPLTAFVLVAGLDGFAAAVSPTMVALLIWSSRGYFSARYFSPNFSMLA